MPYYRIEPAMSKREPTARELDRTPERDLDMLLALAESSLAKDWLTPEEDAAWDSL
jgi:hypothetical protein